MNAISKPETEGCKTIPVPILFHSDQFAITKFGIACRCGGYSIPRDVLAEIKTDAEGDSYYRWPVHVARMSCVDRDDFMLNFLIGAHLHSYHIDVYVLVSTLARIDEIPRSLDPTKSGAWFSNDPDKFEAA